MLYSVANFKILYNYILKKALECDGLGCTIFIFVNNDCDSLASLKILTTLLKSDEVQYQVIPAFSNGHIVSELNNLHDSKYLRSLLFVNCGGQIDMTTQWFYQKDNVKCYLADSHRPYNHKNVIDDCQKIFVLHDGCKSFEECPTKEDEAIYYQLKEDIGSDEESDEYGSDFSDMSEAKQELEELKQSQEDGEKNPEKDEDDDDEEVDENGDVIENIEKVGQKRQAKSAIVDNRKLKRQKMYKFSKYYKGSYYGKSASFVFYQLVTQLNKVNKDYLWYWIVGIGDYQIHGKASELEIQEEVGMCNDEIDRLCSYVNKQSTSGPLVDTSNLDYKDRDLFKETEGKLQTNNMEVGQIRKERDLNIMLLRHWSLYESISNSNHFVSKLEILREPQQKKFKRFLAQIGCPLEQAKQKYMYMDSDLRNNLKQNILDKSQNDEYKIDKILINNFVRQMTEILQISATDQAYAVSSLLDYPHHINAYNDEQTREFKKSQTETHKKQQDDRDKENVNTKNKQMAQIQEQILQDRNLENLNNCLNDNFWIAFDSLDSKNTHILQKGITLAKEMQQAIIRVGGQIIDRKEVKMAQHFRYVTIENDQLLDIQLLQFPLALQKLGMFIIEEYQGKRKNAKDKPLILSIKNSKSGFTMVVAVMGYQREVDSRNSFGDYFRDAAATVGCKSKHESFETGIVEIKNEEFRAFIQKMQEYE